MVGYHCDADASVAAVESADEVRLTFRVYGRTGNGCARSEEIQLDKPLGDRRIVDAATGEEVQPCRASALPPDPTACL